MSDYGNGPPDEPTRAYTPVSGNDDATRLERPIAPYSEERQQVPPTVLPPGYRDRETNVAALVTVGLLCILIGLGLGYLLFHDSSSGDTPSTTTSSSAVSTTSTTVESTTTSTTSSTSTTAKPTTTTTVKTTTTAKPTTTTAKPSTTTTTSGDTVTTD